ncbi:sirohydrochlorin chelatase [Lentzea nigeriaca]|uniref:sirohydrochlorin chelatase n=1 Tax=Lentzea nigeriaca TaxID=1128665 RepID=UPI00195AC9A6|nr:CbiX/SirB N-terminal domain-containing protein [Lentzea nigeriaca]MBM7861636.1 sirohydrochlorin ferrochelatase [Lentzea nigeriaca]
MKLVVAFHGTRDPRGAVVCEEIAASVQSSVDVPVEVAYADVRQPDVRSVVDGPCVVVPAFLAAGYHVRVDIPEQIGNRQGVVLTSPLGVDAVPAVRDRLREAGFRRGDAVVLAAAGSSDARALADVGRAARMLGAAAVGYVATATPRVADVVAEVRRRPGVVGRRVAVASWLLAPGVFHSSLDECGADVVSAPIGAHPLVVEALLRKYYAARAGLVRSA